MCTCGSTPVQARSLISKFIAAVLRNAPHTVPFGRTVSKICWLTCLRGGGRIKGISGRRFSRCPLRSCKGSQSNTS